MGQVRSYTTVSFVLKELAIILPWILIRWRSKRSWILIRLFSLGSRPSALAFFFSIFLPSWIVSVFPFGFMVSRYQENKISSLNGTRCRPWLRTCPVRVHDFTRSFIAISIPLVIQAIYEYSQRKNLFYVLFSRNYFIYNFYLKLNIFLIRERQQYDI